MNPENLRFTLGMEFADYECAEGLDAASADAAGRTALHLAAAHDRPVMIWSLLGKGADVNAADGSGATALHHAAAAGAVRAAQVLIRGGADAALENGDGQDVAAVATGEVADGLAGWTADPSAIAMPSPLDAVEEESDEDDIMNIGRALSGCLTTMLEEVGNIFGGMFGAELDGATSLMTAVMVGEPHQVAVHLTQGADLDARARDDMTALHIAALGGQAAAAAMLVEAGADPTLVDAHGLSAGDMAALAGHDELAATLGTTDAPAPSASHLLGLFPIAGESGDRLGERIVALGAAAVPDLVAALSTQSFEAMVAGGILAEMGEPALDGMLDAMANGSVEARAGCAAFIGETRIPEERLDDIVDALIALLEDDTLSTEPMPAPEAEDGWTVKTFSPRDVIRRSAASTLASIGAPAARAQDALEAILGDSEVTNEAVLEALRAIGAESGTPSDLSSLDAGSQRSLLKTMHDGPPLPTEQLLELVQSSDERMREALGECLKAWIDRKLYGDDGGVVLAAVELCREQSMAQYQLCAVMCDLDPIPSARWMDLLRIHLDEGAGEARVAATWALAFTGVAEAVGPLTLAARSEDMGLRRAGAGGLAHLASTQSLAVDGLVGIVADPDFSFRGEAALALGAAGDVRAVPHLASLLEEESIFGSKEAAQALGMMGPDASEAIPSLEKMTDDFFCGEAAQAALMAIRGEATAG